MPTIDPSTLKTSRETKGRRLKSLRKMADLSRKDIAQKYQISASTIQAWEEGKAGGLTVKGAQRIIEALKKSGVFATLEWLLHGTGQPPYLAERVYIGAKEESAELHPPIIPSEIEIIEKELNTFRTLNRDVLDMVISDDGMYPFYQKGDVVAGRRYSGEKIRLALDRDCILETSAGQKLCRRIRRGTRDERYHLQCTHLETGVPKPWEYDVTLLSAAPIVWHRRPK